MDGPFPPAGRAENTVVELIGGYNGKKNFTKSVVTKFGRTNVIPKMPQIWPKTGLK